MTVNQEQYLENVELIQQVQKGSITFRVLEKVAYNHHLRASFVPDVVNWTRAQMALADFEIPPFEEGESIRSISEDNLLDYLKRIALTHQSKGQTNGRQLSDMDSLEIALIALADQVYSSTQPHQ
jgi:hypothetical protein